MYHFILLYFDRDDDIDNEIYTYIQGTHISIYDHFFCNNIAHTIAGISTFWSVISSDVVDDVRGVHLLALERSRCNELPYLSFTGLMLNAILHYTTVNGINVYSNNAEFATYYVNNYYNLYPNNIDDEVINGSIIIESDVDIDNNIPRNSPMINKSNYTIKDNIVQRDYNAVYSKIVDKSTNFMFTTNGIKLMKNNLNIICNNNSNNNNNNNNIYQIVICSRNLSRRILNIIELNDLLKNFFKIIFSSGIIWKLEIIDFSVLSPCAQIELVSRTNLFISIHGAEGGGL
jgi:hypothetical protein